MTIVLVQCSTPSTGIVEYSSYIDPYYSTEALLPHWLFSTPALNLVIVKYSSVILDLLPVVHSSYIDPHSVQYSSAGLVPCTYIPLELVQLPHTGPTAARGLYDGWGNERKKRDFELSFKGHIVVLHKNTKKEIFSKKVEFCKKNSKIKNCYLKKTNYMFKTRVIFNHWLRGEGAIALILCKSKKCLAWSKE